jgi:hypothetical protein
MLGEKRTAGVGLERGEPEAPVVVLVEEPHRPRTEVADAVEEDDRPVIGHVVDHAGRPVHTRCRIRAYSSVPEQGNVVSV